VRSPFRSRHVHGAHSGPLFCGRVEVGEPEEAGLFVRSSSQSEFKKVASNDPEVLLFQVGEFGQLLQNDAIRATEHRVHKVAEWVERYAMALFFDPPMDAVVHSTSELTRDTRYGGGPGDPCTYRHWNEASFKRYLMQEEER
jgi:isopenicillin N synthase-like dioxygenase